jgi:hypothetical protein
MNTISTRDKWFVTEVHRDKGSYVSVEVPTNGGLSQRASCLSWSTTKEDWALTMNPHKEDGNTNVSGCFTQRGHLTSEPNRLETTFKSNKRESINLGHHKCFLRWTSDELNKRGSISHLKCLSHPNPRWILARIVLEGSWERDWSSRWCSSRWRQHQVKEEVRGYKYPTPKKWPLEQLRSASLVIQPRGRTIR